MGWLMYRGDTIYKPTVDAYVRVIEEGFVRPCKNRLEDKLKLVKGDAYLRERMALKTYLMMSDVEHLDVDWEAGKLTSLWAEILRPTSSIAETDLKKMLSGHVRYYLSLIKEKRISPIMPDADLVAKARKTLMSVPVQKRYYDLFVNALIDEKYDEAGDDSRANKKFPPITLGDMFTDRQDVLKILTSESYEKEKRWKEVEGPYTDKGHFFVVENVAEGAGLLEREQWVVPLTPEEKADRVPINLRHLADDYDQRYIEQWTDWLMDLRVKQPATVKEAIEVYTTLSRPDWAYLRILRNVEDHTQWKKEKSAFKNKGVNEELNRRLNEKVTQSTGGLRFNLDIKKLADRLSTVPGVFKKTVEFAIPPAGTSGPAADTPLAKYISKLDALRGEMQKLEDTTPNADPRLVTERLDDARKEAEALLQPFDEKTKTLLTPLLVTPLDIVRVKLPPAQTRWTPKRR